MQIDQLAGGWCPHAPVMHAAQPVPPVAPAATRQGAGPGSGSGGASAGRIREGITLATGSLKALFRDRHLLGFSFLAGIALIFLIVAEGWSVTHYASIPLPDSISISFGDSYLIVFNPQLFLIEAICLSGLTCLFAGLILYRNGNHAKKPVTIQEVFSRVNAHAVPLATLSMGMAFVATLVFELITQSQVIGKIIFSIEMTLFYLPYAYYIPNGVSVTALFFSFEIMIINIVLFLVALYVVPGIVLENKGILSAFAGSVLLVKKTWCEVLGCILVFGAIVLLAISVALVIGQSPLLLGHDYDFFLQVSRGKILMMAACYGFVLACGVLAAAGFAALGIAVADLNTLGTTGGQVRVGPKTGKDTAAEVAQ